VKPAKRANVAKPRQQQASEASALPIVGYHQRDGNYGAQALVRNLWPHASMRFEAGLVEADIPLRPTA
jgi:hypothetical protein